MTFITQIKNIKKNFSGEIYFDKNLSKFSWFNLGGPAKVLYKPKNLQELSFFMKEIKGFKDIKVLGAGSNTLIRDGGFDGIIIRLGQPFSHLSLLKPNLLIAGASALDRNVSKFAIDSSLSGLEFLSCIPGTIGGAIRMNSGCYGSDISKVLVSVQAMNFDGNIEVINSSDIKFSYRGSDLKKDLIFISATFKGIKNEKINVEEKTNTLIKQKKDTQPSKIKTCGSTFKNPQNNSAWKLIKNSGCAGMSVGDAYISKKHCNFFVNNGKAKSEDLEKLINKVKKKVFDKTGINLELEIQIIGEKL